MVVSVQPRFLCWLQIISQTGNAINKPYRHLVTLFMFFWNKEESFNYLSNMRFFNESYALCFIDGHWMCSDSAYMNGIGMQGRSEEQLNFQWSKSRDSSVGTVNRLRVGRSMNRRPISDKDMRYFSSPQCPDRLWGPLGFLSNGCWRLFPRAVQRQRYEADHLPSSCTEAKNVWSYPLIKQWNKFTVYFIYAQKVWKSVYCP
jgi:hypothetical protein